MSVVKNFGFGYPLIKTTAASRSHGRAVNGSDTRSYNDHNGSSFFSSRFSAIAANGREMSLRQYEAWCQQQRAALDHDADEQGMNGRRQGRYRSFLAAREFARSLGLASGSDWRRYVEGRIPHLGECPKDIPTTPQRTYRNDGWQGYGDWLGIDEA